MNTITKSVASLFVAAETAQINANAANIEFANAMAAIFQPGITFVQHGEAMLKFKADYKVAKPQATDGAVDTAFSRALTRMNDYLKAIDAPTYSIPKAETAEAVKKAEQRAERAAKVESLAKTVKPAELSNRAAKGDKLAVDALALIGKKARDAADAKVSGLLKSIRAELKNADEAELRQIAKILAIKV